MNAPAWADDTTYPNLGFNPVPGKAGDVEALVDGFTKATDSLSQGSSMLGKITGAASGAWQGDAGDAFRSSYDDKLTPALTTAHTSMSQALAALKGWYGQLTSNQDYAAQLDKAAADAKAEVARTQQAAKQAQGNPAFGMLNTKFETQQALAQAQSQIDAAESDLRDANNAAESAQNDLNDILTKARTLMSDHEVASLKYAQQLEDAKGVAPSAWGDATSEVLGDIGKGADAVGDWFKDHVGTIHTVLSGISSIAGIVAMVTPPPVDAIAGAVGAVAGLGSMACDLTDPKTRAAVDGLFHGQFTASNLKAVEGLGEDAMGMIPGGKIAKEAVSGANVALDGLKAGKGIPELASRIPGVAKLGEGATDAFKSLAGQSGRVANIAKGLSNDAHSVSKPVEIGAKFVEKMLSHPGSTFHFSQSTVSNVNLAYKGATAAHSLYDDVKDLF